MNTTYRDTMHKYGRIFIVIGIGVMFLAPVVTWIVTGVGPDGRRMFGGILVLSIIFLPGGLIEMMTYSPILGTSATYLAFVTGNLVNLKVPCVMNATEICNTKIGTPENEVVGAVSVAFSSITTVVIITLGVILLIPLRPVLNSPVLQPAFNWVISALFGALGYKYFKANWKMAIAPMAIIILLSIFLPEFVNGNVSIMIPIMAVLTVGVSRLLYVKEII